MQYRRLLQVIILAFSLQWCSHSSYAQVYQWAHNFGISWAPGYESGEDLKMDKQGNVIMSGYLRGDSIDFDPGSGTAYLSSTVSQGATGNDAFLAKYSPSGGYIWAKIITVDTTQADYSFSRVYCSSFTVDDSGNIYAVGAFVNAIDFDPGPGIASLISTPTGSSSQYSDIFIAKYNASGDLVWVHGMGSKYVDQGTAIALDNSGNIIVAGAFSDTVDFDPGPGVTNLIAPVSPTSTVTNGNFVAKYAANGDFMWAKSIFNDDDFISAIVVDGAGHIYMAGEHDDHPGAGSSSSLSDFDPGPASYYLASNNQDDGFFAKYDSSFNFIWAKGFTGPRRDWTKSLQLDAASNIYIAGIFQDTVDFDPGPGIHNLISPPLSIPGQTVPSVDFFIAKYDSTGSYIWAEGVGGPGDEDAVMVIDRNKLYLTGQFSETVDFDPGPGIANEVSFGNENIFIAAYDTSGAYLWSKGIGSISDDEIGAGLAVDSAQNLYVTGTFRGIANFNPSSTAANLTSNGGPDIFLSKYAPICLPQLVQNPQHICQGTSYLLNGHEYTLAGTYLDTLQTVLGGCDSVINTVLDIESIDTVVTISNATLTAEALNASYQWLDCATGSTIPGATAQSFTATVNGAYSVALESITTGCADTSACMNITNVGVAELGHEITGFVLFPNPANDRCTVYFPQSYSDATLTVYTVLGQEVVCKKTDANQRSVELKLNPGIYLVSLRTESGANITQRLIML